ncbi:MAG: hypothetical protein GF364_03275 [Candidatus Lokiarchaeota archaeon]|nr:hypothetical protein [Candidatus Lokiarchaeota archaeon]
MNSTMHATSAYLVYNGIYWLWFETNPPSLACFLIIIFGIFPDFDGLYFSLKTKTSSHGTEFQHHLNSWFHWPICWFPLIIVFLLSLIFNFYPQYFIIPMLGIYLHMIFDSAACGDGMMWLHGFKKTDYARYINLYSSKTDGYHGNYWGARYQQTVFYILENILAGITISLTIWYMIRDNSYDFWNIGVIILLIAFILGGILGPRGKFKEEPKEGRYADYREHSGYLNWMKENNYIFNEKRHPVKKREK